MQFTYAAISALLASVAYSQSVASEMAKLPSCALICLSTAISSAGCSFADHACQCGPAKDDITKSATPCIASSCSATDSMTASNVAAQVCALEASGSTSASASGSSIAASSTTSAAAAATETGAGNRVAAAGVMVGAGLLAAFAL
ncbi:hypothetical protein SBOR_1141 [Sclerotinia borealis F-4128]|uniref:CFEM domain-containing protein n=1 Tax=Sclerotinia borealis (strain F-4128) TaxID=1432307 RepID=W9CV55_SCLBF|nr:hypothetical protein SBOR_1141 [Sclerotinia borealis F-4128]